MNIFVYGLNFKARRDDLISLFAPFGEVINARIIVDKETHRSRGYGFVEMPDDEQGKAAMAAINDTEFMGRIVHTDIAKEREQKTI